MKPFSLQEWDNFNPRWTSSTNNTREPVAQLILEEDRSQLQLALAALDEKDRVALLAVERFPGAPSAVALARCWCCKVQKVYYRAKRGRQLLRRMLALNGYFPWDN